MRRFQTKFFMLVAVLWFGIASESVGLGGVKENINTITEFFNVAGSSADKLPLNKTSDGSSKISSWIQYWAYIVGDKNNIKVCFVDGCGKKGDEIGGGHVVKKINLVCPWPGSNDVYILPICKTHNGKDVCYGMISRTNVVAVRLDNYRKKDMLNFGSMVVKKRGTPFWNKEETGRDPYFIHFWAEMHTKHIGSLRSIFCVAGNDDEPSCEGGLLGAHIVFEEREDADVYILPLCLRHKIKGGNESKEMTLKSDIYAVRLAK